MEKKQGNIVKYHNDINKLNFSKLSGKEMNLFIVIKK
jgi:hypothetical protein